MQTPFTEHRTSVGKFRPANKTKRSPNTNANEPFTVQPFLEHRTERSPFQVEQNIEQNSEHRTLTCGQRAVFHVFLHARGGSRRMHTPCCRKRSTSHHRMLTTHCSTNRPSQQSSTGATAQATTGCPQRHHRIQTQALPK